MKSNSLLSILFLSSIIVLSSCASKENKESAADEDEWAALDEFHAVMADVYHPLKDSGNVQPIMERAQELAQAADKLAAAPLPEKVNTAEVKAMLASLQKDANALAFDIKDGAPEDQAGTQLEELHTLFHQVQEAWYGGHNEHKEH